MAYQPYVNDLVLQLGYYLKPMFKARAADRELVDEFVQVTHVTAVQEVYFKGSCWC
jgi:hypothetical protein